MVEQVNVRHLSVDTLQIHLQTQTLQGITQWAENIQEPADKTQQDEEAGEKQGS